MPAPTETVTGVSAVNGAPSSVPVTVIVVDPAPSASASCDRLSRTSVDAVSLSGTVTATSAAATDP